MPNAPSAAVEHIPPKNQHTVRYYLITMEPIRVPALSRWAQEDDSESIDASHLPWQAPELPLDDQRILVLDGDPRPTRRVLRFLSPPHPVATRRTPHAAGREGSALGDC